MEMAYSLDCRRALRRDGDDTWEDTPREFPSYTRGERKAWWDRYQSVREAEEHTRMVKRDLEEVEERALKRQRKMQDKQTSTEKPKPERKRKTSEPHPNEGKKARQSFSDSDSVDQFGDIDDDGEAGEAQRAYHQWKPSGITARDGSV